MLLQCNVRWGVGVKTQGCWGYDLPTGICEHSHLLKGGPVMPRNQYLYTLNLQISICTLVILNQDSSCNYSDYWKCNFGKQSSKSNHFGQI